MATVNLHADSTSEGHDIVSMAVRVRTNLAIHHLFAACRFTTTIRQIERENEGRPLGDFWDEILHNALGVLALSTAALEAFANELYFEYDGLGTDLNHASKEIVCNFMDMKPALEKFALIIAIHTGNGIPRGDEVVQNVDALISLRNSILHFRPEWHGEVGDHANKSRKVKYRFALSPLFPGEPALPRAWANGSFAIWALESVIQFLDFFCKATKIENPCDKFRSQLSLYSANAI